MVGDMRAGRFTWFGGVRAGETVTEASSTYPIGMHSCCPKVLEVSARTPNDVIMSRDWERALVPSLAPEPPGGISTT